MIGRLLNSTFLSTVLRTPDDGTGTGDGTSDGTGDGTGGTGDPWYLTADLKLDDDTKKFLDGKKPPDIATALRSAREADTVARSRNVIDRPDPKNLDAWKGWTDLGWTERLDDYRLEKPEIPEGMTYDEGMQEHLRKVAHEHRVPPGAAQQVLNGLVGYQQEQYKALQASGAKSETDLQDALKKDWGDKWNTNRELATRAARFLGVGVDETAELDDILGSAPMVQLFHKIGSLLGEDTLQTTASPGGVAAAQSAEAARLERQRLEADPAWMAVFNNPRHAQNADFVAQRNELLKREAVKKAA